LRLLARCPFVTRNPLELDRLVVARAPQGRADGATLEVYDDAGPVGTFTEHTPDDLDGASVVRLADATGGPILTVLHPGRTAKARVDGLERTLGFVSRVGRVRSNLELHGPGRRPEGDPMAVLHAVDDGDGWSGVGAVLRWWRVSDATAASYGEARYSLELRPTVDPELRPLLLAAVVLVDRAIVQVSP
jgi:hypothetical protein